MTNRSQRSIIRHRGAVITVPTADAFKLAKELADASGRTATITGPNHKHGAVKTRECHYCEGEGEIHEDCEPYGTVDRPCPVCRGEGTVRHEDYDFRRVRPVQRPSVTPLPQGWPFCQEAC